MSHRPDRIAREIQRVLGQPLSEFAIYHGGGLLTLTDVKVSPDLTIAKLYVSVYGNSLGKEKIIQLLNENAQFFRSQLAQLHVKVIPQVRFYLDSTLDAMDRIERLLKSNTSQTDHGTTQ